jgi:hypothetical protein
LANPNIGVTRIAHRFDVSPAMLYRYIPAAHTTSFRTFEKAREPWAGREVRCPLMIR